MRQSSIRAHQHNFSLLWQLFSFCFQLLICIQQNCCPFDEILTLHNIFCHYNSDRFQYWIFQFTFCDLFDVWCFGRQCLQMLIQICMLLIDCLLIGSCLLFWEDWSIAKMMMISSEAKLTYSIFLISNFSNLKFLSNLPQLYIFPFNIT